MPSVEYSTSEVQKLLGGDLTLAELEHGIPMLGVDLECVTDERIALEVFPNRPDLLSVEGFARALRGFFGVEKGFIDYKVSGEPIKFSVESSVKEVRPALSAAAVLDVPMSEEVLLSIIDVQEKLHTTHGRNRVKVAIGVHDMKQLKAPFTYKAVAPKDASFVPLEMNKELNLQQILSQHPKGRDYAWTLSGKKKYPLIVDSAGQVLSFPPIINGELTRVTQDSTDLFIESTGSSQTACDQAVAIIASSLADRGGKIRAAEILPAR